MVPLGYLTSYSSSVKKELYEHNPTTHQYDTQSLYMDIAGHIIYSI